MSKTAHPFEVKHRDVWAIALPATFAFVTEPLAGLVDLTVIGRLGDAGLLGGLVLGTLVFSILFSMTVFIRLGTAGLVAQAVGAREEKGALTHLARALIIGVVLGALGIVASGLIERISLWLLAPEVDAQPALSTYLQVRLWSAPLVLINFALLGWFYGRAEATTGLVLQIIVHVGNMIFSIAFVYGFGWGVGGVAAGTVLAQGLAAVCGCFIVLRQLGGAQAILAQIPKRALLEISELRRLFSLSRDIMIRSAALMTSFAYFTAQTARMGTLELSANAIVLNFLMVTAFLQDGQAQAAKQLCGKAVGARYQPAFDQAIVLTLFWGFVVSGALFIGWMVGGPFMIDVMTTEPDVRETARNYIFIASLTTLTGVVPFVMDGVMIGATMNNLMRNGMLVALAVFFVACWVLQPVFGLMGLWAALHLFFVTRGAIFYIGVQQRKPALFA